jgi:hypothetical protein
MPGAAGCATGDAGRVDEKVPIDLSCVSVSAVETVQLKSDVGNGSRRRVAVTAKHRRVEPKA